jgi:hypothetical protein
MGNIFNHNRLPFNFRLDRSEYWDFYLSQPSYGSDNVDDGLADGCLISYIDTTDPDCIWFNNLYSKSKYSWDKAVNNGLLLKNIGYTGVDNGLINYQKDRTSNEEFLKLFKNSEFKIDKDDLRLLLNKVYGNNQIFSYDNDIVEEDGMIVSKLNGGFYQGFFMTDDNYKVLPKNIGDGLTFEIVLKKHDFDNNGGYRLNDRYNGNKGIFLYIGTRAENKWWEEYITEYKPDKINNGFIIDGYVNSEYNISDNINENYLKPFKDLYSLSDYFSDGYLTDECTGCCCPSDDEGKKRNYVLSSMPKFTYPEALNVYEDNAVWFDKDGHLWIENEMFTTNRNSRNHKCDKRKHKCTCNEYFGGGYISDDYYSGPCDCTMYVNDEYIKPETEIDADEELVMKDGYSVRQINIKEYRSNNKFLLFDRTCNGFTTDNWEDGSEVIITDILTPKMKNYFLLFDRTCNGFTTDTIDKLISEESKKYDILNDLYRNAIAFQIDDNGRIGYKYLLKDCDSYNSYKIESEWSGENVIKSDTWNTVTIKMIPITKKYDDCTDNISLSDRMKFMFYVNGRLKFISKELPVFNFRKLNDMYSKQEGVPYNISLGGGTQGLCDVIYLNYRDLPKYILPLEKEFAGTFIGYIKTLRIYNCGITFSEIVQNAIFDGHF